MLSEIEDEKDTQSNDLTEQFIEEYIHTQKAKVKSRKLIQEMLFFIGCQVASASLATLLFQFAVEVIFTSWLCLFVAWIPSLSALTEVHFQKTEDGWTLKIMNKPLTTVIKFVTGVGITTATILQVQQEITRTNQAIQQVYSEIERYETPTPASFLPPFTAQAFLASIAIVSIVAILRNLKNRSPF
jgi:hypothetical protein